MEPLLLLVVIQLSKSLGTLNYEHSMYKSRIPKGKAPRSNKNLVKERGMRFLGFSLGKLGGAFVGRVRGPCSMRFSAGVMSNKAPSNICEAERRLDFDT